MLSNLDLSLLMDQLNSLVESSYFHKDLEDYCQELRGVVQEALRANPRPSTLVLSQITTTIWTACNFLKGSTSREIPYEVVYCLELALKDWEKRPAIITTALSEEKQFYFLQLDPWNTICSVFPASQCTPGKPILVHVVLPRLYRRLPLFITPLYHELGHFVDLTAKITEASFLLEGRINVLAQELFHRREHFADLFSASYCGRAAATTLNELAPNHPASVTHPSTADRVGVIDAFLDGSSHSVIELFRRTLQTRGMPELVRRYERPELEKRFANFVPCTIRSKAEVHGIFEAGLEFLVGQLASRIGSWSAIEDYGVTRIVNDLTEKSIRSFAIKEGWKSATS